VHLFLIGFVKSWSVIHRGTYAILAEGDSTFMMKSLCLLIFNTCSAKITAKFAMLMLKISWWSSDKVHLFLIGFEKSWPVTRRGTSATCSAKITAKFAMLKISCVEFRQGAPIAG